MRVVGFKIFGTKKLEKKLKNFLKVYDLKCSTVMERIFELEHRHDVELSADKPVKDFFKNNYDDAEIEKLILDYIDNYATYSKVDRIALERVNGKFIPVNTEVAPEDDCPF